PKDIANSDLNTGGPVEPGRGFVLHSPDYTSSSTLKVNDEVCLTATLEILRDLALGRGPESFFIALGYSGWSAGQLEDEIASNGWLTCTHDAAIIYDRDNSSKYSKIMQHMGIDPSYISQETGHA
ncbi:MAG: YqgE/AlgH family protein, partial [Salaquimonas sp.]